MNKHTSTSSPASEDSPLQPMLPGMIPESSASKTTTAQESSTDIGPVCQSSGTSGSSTAASGEGQTSSQEDFLANHSVKPGSSEAQAMTVTSGLKCSELLKKQDPVGSLQRMLLESSRWHSTMCFLNWKAKGTPQGRLLFQLAPSTPHTDEIESGSLPTYGAKPGQRIPTPTASDHIERKSTSKEKLNYQTNKSVSLDRFVKMWPTPIATDGSKCPTGSLAKTVEAGHPYLNKNGTPIAHKKKWWSTPTASDHKGAPKNRYMGSVHSHGNLSEQARTSPTSGQLNPTWVEWLMGYPSGWTDLKPSETP